MARRVASYNQGVVTVTPALDYNKAVQVVIEQLDTRWQSSIIVGVVAGPLERLNFPVNALALKGPSCVVANDWISINGVKVYNDDFLLLFISTRVFLVLIRGDLTMGKFYKLSLKATLWV